MKSKSKIVSCLLLIVLFVMALCTLVSCSPKFSEWQITKQPTCTEDGEMVRYRKGVKSETETKVIPAKGHIYPNDGAWEIVPGKEPTHTTEGEEIRTCSRCHQSETRPVQPIDYDYTLKINDGKKTVQTIYLKAGEEYAVDVEFLKTGYKFIGLKDGDNDFPLSGTLSENKTVTVNWEILPTTTFQELSERLAAGVDRIFIDADIEMAGSAFVVGNTEIYVAENRTVRRAANFLGDMFVIGETPDGQNAFLLSGKNASLDLKTNNGATLTFDGNKSVVTGDVNGTCFLVLHSATVNMYDGVTVQNFKKTANSKIVNDGYKISYPNKIGGAGMIVADGTFNMYGGRFAGNEVNIDETFDGDESESEARVSSCGARRSDL